MTGFEIKLSFSLTAVGLVILATWCYLLSRRLNELSERRVRNPFPNVATKRNDQERRNNPQDHQEEESVA